MPGTLIDPNHMGQILKIFGECLTRWGVGVRLWKRRKVATSSSSFSLFLMGGRSGLG